MCEDPGIASLLVSNAWLRDVQANRLNPELAVRVCEKARDCARAWGARPLARAASVAVSVLHDEYRHDPGAALEELGRAGDEFGMTDGRVLIGKAKVLYGMQNFTAAIRRLSTGLKDNTVDGVDRVFAMRLFGVSVAKTGDWARAASVFLEAANVRRCTTVHCTGWASASERTEPSQSGSSATCLVRSGCVPRC